MNSGNLTTDRNGNRNEPAGTHQHGVRTLPSFFVIGPPRTGTSWLHTVLSHSAWLSDPTKETRFFDKHFHRGLDWYRSHYRKASPDRCIGEIAPTYFASNEARERIARLIPEARVVCTFRNPVDRVLSLYRLKRAYGLIPWNFEDALERDPELIESSRYAAHLTAWQRDLGSQVLATVFDDMQRDPQSYLNTLVDFVGVPRFELAPSQVRRVLSSESMTQPRSYRWTRSAALLADWSRARRLDTVVAKAKNLGFMKLFLGGGPAFSELSHSETVKLYEFFRPEVEKLEAVLNRDLSAWKHPAEPVRQTA
jgi:Sulfotransferase domain